jgi:rfaE bifunctional protein kinase chain/domain/rfaE bifunctional protein nucleotidyltransferase chain/domain
MQIDNGAGAKEDKIKQIDELARVTESLREDGKNVVQCHGVFDLLHVGHIRHFEEARAHGDILIVTLTPDRYVGKGPNRPAFPEELRAEALAALREVDYVAVSNWPTAVETIRLLKPAVYAKGPDYSDMDSDYSGGIHEERTAVESYGGKIAFTSDITFSSSSLINRYVDVLPPETQEYLKVFEARHGQDSVVKYLEGAERLRVLVIGETIIDEYQYCRAIGKSSKDPMLVVQLTNRETTPGGILAVANHVSSLAQSVSMVTAIGDPGPYDDIIASGVRESVDRHLLRREETPTLVKRRIVEPYYDQKLLEMYEMDSRTPTPTEEEELCTLLERLIPQMDLVVVVDFGHGMLSSRSIEVLTSESRFLTVNAQSNAGNFGYHTVSRYARADYISMTEGELRLDAQDRTTPVETLINQLADKLDAKLITVTRGAQGSLCFDRELGIVEVPAIATKVVDRVGAGDAYLSVGALCAAQGAPAEVVGLIGSAAAAQAVTVVGNAGSVDAVALRKHLETLFK